ncbi:V-type ATP synthase subunit D [Candidatus Dependentiae bacterium]|nr:V-type ATP synthase subunit D [Candidatus Dependentiae bacterium]
MKILTTKTNLLEQKKQLKLAEEGYKLLDQKYEILVMELMNSVYNLRANQDILNKNFKMAYTSMTKLIIKAGEARTGNLLETISKPMDFKLDISMRSVMGVQLPVVSFQEIKHGKTDLGILNAFPEVDRTIDDFDNVFNYLAKYSEIYITILRLIKEIKKTKRRVNALENMFIPEYKGNIKMIESVLEESEREEFFKRKLVKRKKARG